MKKPEVVSAFEQRLNGPLGAKGFQGRKSDRVYLRKDGDITCFFDVTIHAMTGWFMVRPMVFVGSEQVNRLYSTAVGRPFKAREYTCGFAVHNVTDQKRGHYPLESADSIPDIADSVLRDYEDFGAPFHSQYASLEGIDLYLNTPREGKTPAGSVSRACLGLVAAHLRGRSDVRQLAENYYSFWSVPQGPKIAGAILQTADHLCGALALSGAQRKTPSQPPQPTPTNWRG